MQTFHPGDEVRRAFWSAAKAPTQRRFECALNHLEGLPHGTDVGEYIRVSRLNGGQTSRLEARSMDTARITSRNPSTPHGRALSARPPSRKP